MNKNKLINISIIAFGLIFIMSQVVVSKRFADYTGTDDKSVGIINEVAPDYEPWVKTVFDFSNDQNEVLLFALQGAIGMGVIVFYIIKQRHKKI